jgi:adenine-specific DNA methylase
VDAVDEGDVAKRPARLAIGRISSDPTRQEPQQRQVRAANKTVLAIDTVVVCRARKDQCFETR